MEAALALEMKDSEFIEIIKLAIKFDTNLRAASNKNKRFK